MVILGIAAQWLGWRIRIPSILVLLVCGILAGSEVLVPQTFFVIIGTVALYGLTAPWVGRRLGLAKEHPQGVLFMGVQ